MQRKKGFTLVELIGVILLIGVIALITVPTITNIINDANKSAFEDSAYGLIHAGELYYSNKEMMGEELEDEIFTFPDDIGDLMVSGKLPESGNMKINEDGEISLAITNGRFCITKSYKDKEIVVSEDIENCIMLVLITNITLNKTNISLNKGETSKIEVNFEPFDATNRKLKYTSSNTNVVTVDANGIITAIGGGNTTITISTIDGSEISKTINVTVIGTVNDIEINTTSVSIVNGGTYQLEASVVPETSNNKELKYTSSDTSVATVTEDGLITGVSGGTATITISTTDGSNISKEVSVTVRQQVSSITIDKTEVTLNVGSNDTVTATVQPDNTYTKTLNWLSNDESIATVEDGLITGVKVGTTTITVSTTDGSNISKTINVTVKQLVTDITVNTTTVSIVNGGTHQLTASVTPSAASNKTLSYTSNNTNIATVSSTGLVTGISGGTATITISTTDGTNISKTVEVTVRQQVSDITLDKTSIEINAGTSEKVTAIVLPDNAYNKTLNWISNDESMATVEDGLITGIKAGTTTVTVNATDGSNVSKTIDVTILQPVTGVSISGNQVVNVGSTTTLTATVSPSTAANKTLTWSTSDSSIATVTDGVVTGKKAGTVTITATTTDGTNLSKSIEVTVNQLVNDITLNTTTLSIVNGGTYQLSSTVTPSDATNKTLKYTSSNTSIATVSSTGLVTGITGGTATITVSTIDGSNISKTVEVTVRQMVTGLTLSASSVTIEVGNSKTITATITPTNAYNKTLNWVSNDTSVATVSNGVITGVKAGTTTITVSTTDGSNISKTVEVTVNKPIDPNSLTALATTSTEVTEVPACITDGSECTAGTQVAIKVNENETYNFYVISESNNEVTLIMDRNLGDNVAWYADSATNKYGPLTAVAALKERTTGWTNIPEKEYTYSDDGGANKYTAFTETMRARMLTYTEATTTLGCEYSASGSCPSWLHINLKTTGSDTDDSGNYKYGYWTSAAAASLHFAAYTVSASGSTGNDNTTYTSSGLRPVIELSK